MKKYFSVASILLFSFYAIAQPANTVPDGTYGKDGTKTTTVKNDGLGNETRTEEYFDGSKPPKLRFKEEVFKNLLTGDSTIVRTFYYDGYSGDISSQSTYTYREGEIVTTVHKTFYKDGGVKKEERQTALPDGGIKIEVLDKKTGEYKTTRIITKKELDTVDTLGKKFKPLEPLSQNCQPKIKLFGGYSYLNSEFGNERESFPVGFQAIALFNVTPHINTGINISYHKKTDGDLTFSRTFVMAEGQYMFGDMSDCSRRCNFDLHILAGLGSERIKYDLGGGSNSTSGSGFAFGAGGGFEYRISDKFGLGVQADWLGVKFKDSDEMNSSIRASVGASFWIGKRFYKRADLQLQ